MKETIQVKLEEVNRNIVTLNQQSQIFAAQLNETNTELQRMIGARIALQELLTMLKDTA